MQQGVSGSRLSVGKRSRLVSNRVFAIKTGKGGGPIKTGEPQGGGEQGLFRASKVILYIIWPTVWLVILRKARYIGGQIHRF
jgi:hypothetical protein